VEADISSPHSLATYSNKQLVIVAACLWLLALSGYLYCAATLPAYFSVDNYANRAATEYIAKHHSLPKVKSDDPDILYTSLGTTRLLRPPLTYIVSAVLYNISNGSIDDRQLRLRLGSVVLGSLTVVAIFSALILAIQHLWLSLAGTFIFALLPRFVFLASTNNDDIGAIFAATLLVTSVLYLWHHHTKSRALMFIAVAVGLTLQAKFTAWLLLPWMLLLALYVIKIQLRKIIKLIPVLILLMVVAGGWWPIHNMNTYGWQDPTGMKHVEVVQLERKVGSLKSRGYQSQGISASQLLVNHDEFMQNSFKSIVGYLAWIKLEMSALLYGFYATIFVIAMLSPLIKPISTKYRFGSFLWVTMITIVFQFGFYIDHNLRRDIQPDGRYLLPVLVLFVVMFISAVERISIDSKSFSISRFSISRQNLIAVLLLAACILLATYNFYNNVFLNKFFQVE